jgi:hypothetical protein
LTKLLFVSDLPTETILHDTTLVGTKYLSSRRPNFGYPSPGDLKRRILPDLRGWTETDVSLPPGLPEGIVHNDPLPEKNLHEMVGHLTEILPR